MSFLSNALRSHAKRVAASRLADAEEELKHINEQISELEDKKTDIETRIKSLKFTLGR